jgi:hypothetical protein
VAHNAEDERLGRIRLDWFWRESAKGGVHAFGSEVLINPAGASDACYLGNQGDLEIQWAPLQHTIVAFNLAGFERGRFLTG